MFCLGFLAIPEDRFSESETQEQNHDVRINRKCVSAWVCVLNTITSLGNHIP